MKTIVISGASSNVGKTTVARKIARLLPGTVYIKIGHGDEKPDQEGEFFHLGTRFKDIVSKYGNTPFIIIESNSILNEIKPDLLVYLTGDSKKPTAEKAEEIADIKRGDRLDKLKIEELALSLSVEETIIRKIAWISGARPCPLTEIILACGRNSRIGLENELPAIGNKPLSGFNNGSLSELFDDFIAVTALKNNCNFKGIRAVRNKFPGQGFLGPIVTGLKESVTELNFISASDISEIDSRQIFEFFEFSEEYDIVIPSFREYFAKPPFGVYKKCVIGPAERILAEERKKVDSIFSSVKTKIINTQDIK